MIATLAQLGREFFRIIRERDRPALALWLAAAKLTALAGFANRLARDLGAVEAALNYRGVRDRLKGKSIDSSSSNVRCMGGQVSICCACVP